VNIFCEHFAFELSSIFRKVDARKTFAFYSASTRLHLYCNFFDLNTNFRVKVAAICAEFNVLS